MDTARKLVEELRVLIEQPKVPIDQCKQLVTKLKVQRGFPCAIQQHNNAIEIIINFQMEIYTCSFFMLSRNYSLAPKLWTVAFQAAIPQ